MTERLGTIVREYIVRVTIGPVALDGILRLPEGARAVVLFAHGSGSGRLSPRNRHVAGLLNEAKVATLLVDLLTADEETIDAHYGASALRYRAARPKACRRNRLAHSARPDTRHLAIGYFGASTGAAAALVAATQRGDVIGAIVSRGGRPDLAGTALPHVRAPTLLIVGGNDVQVIQLNRIALAKLHCKKQLIIVPGATHLFEEPGALDEVARLACEWFQRYLFSTARHDAERR